MNQLLIVAFAVVMCAAVSYAGFPVAFRHTPHAFHGHYPGHCGNDGFYYKDSYSFVICSNGNSYDQPCAPGTRNSDYGHYHNGRNYHYRDFCDINLVDYGFGAHYDPRRYDLPYAGYGHGYGYGYEHGGHGFGGYGYGVGVHHAAPVVAAYHH